MQDEEKTIDVGDAEEQEQEIDLDAQPAKETKEEEKIEVEKVEAEEPAPVEDPKEELSDYSEGVNKRIAKLTRKMREAERQKEEAINYAKTVKENAAKIQNRYNNLDESYAKEFEKRVTTNLDATKQKLAQAIHAGDIDKQVEAQSELSQLSMEASRLARVKELQDNKPVGNTETPQQPPPQQPRPQQPADPKAEAWAAKNPWFGTDNAMTYTAFDIHKNLVEQEGFDPFSDDYYAEVDKRIRLDFPHKFGKVQESAVEQEGTPVQNVASAKRPAAKGRRKTVRLTPSQVAISKRLGVPLEEYAKQLAAKEV